MPSLNIMKFKFGLSFACGVEPRTVGPVRCRRIVQRKPQGQRGLQLPRVWLNLFGESWEICVCCLACMASRASCNLMLLDAIGCSMMSYVILLS